MVQQGVRTLEDTLRAAKVAEAATATTSDSVPAMLLEALKASAKASEQQAAEIKQLTARVASLAAEPRMPPPATAQQVAPVGDRQQQGFRTPQNQQRAAYAQRSAPKMDAGARPFRQPDASNPECGRCGLRHAAGNCRADGQECRRCGRRGHYARVCRSARANRD